MTASPLSATTTGPRFALLDTRASIGRPHYAVIGATRPWTTDLGTATTWTEAEADTLAANNPTLPPVLVPEPGTPAWFERLADDQHVAKQAAIVEALIDGIPQAESVTTVREWTLAQPALIDHPWRPDVRLVAYAVRVSTTTYTDGTEPYVTTEAHAKTATRTGKPHANGAPYWTSMPDTLADRLQPLDLDTWTRRVGTVADVIDSTEATPLAHDYAGRAAAIVNALDNLA